LLKDEQLLSDAYEILKEWMNQSKMPNEVLKVEYIKILIELGKSDEALKEVLSLLDKLHQSLTRHYCSQCGYNSDNIFWRCPQCREWETIQFRWKI
jgi:lipopolysaccharide biosynthesis regulator YciM